MNQHPFRLCCCFGSKVFMLVLAWVVVVGLSWADLLDLQDDMLSPLADLQQAIEPDLDELRDDPCAPRLESDTLDPMAAFQLSCVAAHPFQTNAAVPLTDRLLAKLSILRI
ncbi:hypothetical protein FBQ96_01935 [Nitrospirales bacterium NOB]|nr:hypothetical protein [Nitrospirales bacterium NOB]